MTRSMKTAIAAVALSMFAVPASADSIGVYSPETVGAAALGSSEMIVHIPNTTSQRSQTVAPIDVTNIQQVNATPGDGQRLDMSGRDGSLRSCYANGGIAKQDQTLNYFCTFDERGSASSAAASSPYLTPQGVDTGYNGTNNVQDPALLDCVSRGGSLIQLAGNQQFACAM